MVVTIEKQGHYSHSSIRSNPLGPVGGTDKPTCSVVARRKTSLEWWGGCVGQPSEKHEFLNSLAYRLYRQDCSLRYAQHRLAWFCPSSANTKLGIARPGQASFMDYSYTCCWQLLIIAWACGMALPYYSPFANEAWIEAESPEGRDYTILTRHCTIPQTHF